MKSRKLSSIGYVTLIGHKSAYENVRSICLGKKHGGRPRRRCGNIKIDIINVSIMVWT
jgi:hypothetical protein